MAFEIKDFNMSYAKQGDDRSLFNIAREDSDGYPQFYAYQNQEGAYVIQRVTTSGTLKIYGYYATRSIANFASDVTNRVNLTYVEYYQLFP